MKSCMVYILFVCVCVCGQQEPEYPNWSFMADNAFAWSGIGLGSLSYICVYSVIEVVPSIIDRLGTKESNKCAIP